MRAQMVASSGTPTGGALSKSSKPSSIDMKRLPRGSSCKSNYHESSVAFRTRSKRKRKEVSSETGAGSSCSAAGKTKKIKVDEDLCCGICFDSVSQRGVLDSCEHIFCYSCLKTWLQRSSSCPHCKRQVHAVTRRMKDDSVVVEKVEKRVLRETLEREESASVGRVVLVGQVGMNRVIHSQPVMYDDSNLFNVLLGVRNGAAAAQQNYRVHPSSRSGVRADPVMYQGSSVRHSANRYNSSSLPASRPLANSVMNAVQQGMNTANLQATAAGQNYLQHCHFHVGQLVRSQFMQASSSLPATDMSGAVAFMPYSTPGYSTANPFPASTPSWPAQYQQRGIVEVQRPSVCLPYRYPLVRRDAVAFAPLGVHTMPPTSLGSPF